ncbi:hypothetical protein sos41_33700 [Alphaproteobacteria bacterium SO-S41]|nr:hypothetical protein sos41_33700 [Alphaproteobacteria bacterium SO-S41]
MHRTADLIRLALANPLNAAVLDRLEALALPDAWLASGCIFQPVWNGLTGRAPAYGINDYDVFYFDPDTSYEAEDAAIRRCAEAFAGLDADVQVRNQARVHLWYPEKFGQPYAPLKDSADALTRFLAPCCAVALRKAGEGYEIAAPYGLDDLFAMTIRRNPATTGPRDQYEAKAARWKTCWPEVTVVPWSD